MTQEDFKARVSMAYEGREQWEAFLNRVWSIHTSELPHWISVEDELPKVCDAVLTTTPHGTQRVGFYDGSWWLANSPDLVRMGYISHWMRLPAEPMKGGEQ